MKLKYFCKRCEYNTKLSNDMMKHLRIKIKCCRIPKSYDFDYSNDQLLVSTLIPYLDEKTHDLKEEEIKYLSKSNILSDNINEFLNELDDINKNKKKICKYCNIKFDKIYDLKKHVIITCFYNYMINKNKNEKNNNINIVNSNITNNSILEQNIYNINNNNFYINMKNPVSFDDKWDISNINELTQIGILFNKVMYTTLLEELLKNDKNLNVIIDKNALSSLVYKNDVEKYIEMKTKDIIDVTMNKLKNHLLEMNKNTKTSVSEEGFTDYIRKMITKKYIDYTKDSELREKVINCICNVYEKRKDDSVKMLKNNKI